MAPRIQPGNPQWLEWVEAVAVMHEEKGSKAAQTYKKAARSFRQCPVTFTHPDESSELVGVGPGVIKIITRKLKEQCERTGEPFPERPKTMKKVASAASKKRKKGPTSDEEREEEAAKDARRQRTLGGGQPIPGVTSIGLGAAGRSSDPSPPPKKKAIKAYVPRKGSGSYAILLALYMNASFDEHQVWTLKVKVIEDATPYSDTSLVKTSTTRNGGNEPATGFYSAFSNMKALIEKDLVMTDNKRPIKYSLTEAGYTLAEGLCPIAGVAIHAPTFGSDSYSGEARRNSYGAGGSNGKRAATPPLFADEEGGDDDFERQMAQAMQLSRLESSGGRPAYVAPRTEASAHQRAGPLPLPLPLPLERPRHPSSGGSSSTNRTSGPVMDGRKAASGHDAARAAPAAGGPVAGNVDSPFGYYYLDENDQRVLKRDDAEVSQEDVTLATIYRIEYRSRQDLHKMAAGVLRKAPLVRAVPLSGGSTMSGYLRERASNVKAPGFPDAAPAKPADIPSDPLADLLAGFTRPKKVAAKDAMYAAPPEVRRIGAEPPVQGARDSAAFAADVRAIRARASLHGGAASTSQLHPLPPPPPQASAPLPHPPPRQPRPSTSNLLAPPAAGRLNPSRPLERTTSSQNPLAASFDYTPSQPLVNRHPLDPVRDHISTQSYVFQPFKAEVLPRGSFRVVLIVDTREMGTGRNKRTEMMDELTKLGVEVERRALPLGDMLWVARRKEARVDASGKVGGWDDVVLDAIVERKRLDDLCSSIRDGRYVSQKIRIKNSAINHRIYLIEKYDDKAQYEQFGKAIWTCKSQLQVNDGFYVHESSNFKDTIHYLRMRTQIMKDLYQDTDLHIIPDAHIDRPTYLSQQKHLRATHPTKRFLTSYHSFETLNRTDAALTLKQQWASMIQRVQGVSAEKAVQFVERWGTPGEFVEDLARYEMEVRDEIVARGEVGGGGGGGGGKKAKVRKGEDFVVERLGEGGPRGIKGALGGKIHRLFTQGNNYAD